MNDAAAPASPRLPGHFKRTLDRNSTIERVARALSDPRLHTVCQEAKCPNRNSCYSQGTATFLILGGTCTRGCAFCAVGKGRPAAPDAGEPEAVARAVATLGLTYVVITSVTRDDLPDGGAGHFSAVIAAIRNRSPGTMIEVLTPDLQGDPRALQTVSDARPEVFNHNLETVPRMYPAVRPQADYRRSLQLLSRVKASGLPVKSGLMVGLGEEVAEVRRTLDDLGSLGCDLVTVGQYLAPSAGHLPVARFWEPSEFEELKTYGETAAGIRRVLAGPLVRSSLSAHLAYDTLNINQQEAPHATHHHHQAF